MAILKEINYKDSGLNAMNDAIDYCCNTEKMCSTSAITMGISKNPKKAFVVNKFLNNQLTRKRLFKGIIVSMEKMWSNNEQECQEYEKKLAELMMEALKWWENQGFQSVGAVHCNTQHPHFHLQIDTCNVISGKQLSQSLKTLYEFKKVMSASMSRLELNEEVLQNSCIISDIEMIEEDNQNFEKGWLSFKEDIFEHFINQDEEEDEYIHEKDSIFSFTCIPVFMQKELKIASSRNMCVVMDNTKKREMCTVVAPMKKREMCVFIEEN